MYAVNINQTNVGLLTGKYLIEIGGWALLRNGDEKHEEVQEAVRRKWIKLQVAEPKPAEKFQPAMKMFKQAALGSLTIPKPVEAKKKAKA